MTLFERSGKHLFILSLAIGAGALAWGGFNTVMALQAKGDLQFQIKQRESRLAAGLQPESHVQEAAKFTLARGMGVASEFQSLLESTASQTGVKVTQFQTGTLVVDYVSVYGNETLDGVGNLSAQATIQGNIRALFATLERLRAADVPFEFTGLDLMRTAVDSNGQALCSMNVSVNLITKREVH